jgi:fluoride exporter
MVPAALLLVGGTMSGARSGIGRQGARPDARRSQVRSADWRPTRPRGLRDLPWLTLGVIAVGGVLGALARQGLWTAFRHGSGFDWTTLCINVAGCGLIGVLMTVLTEVRHAHRLAGPFFGVGVLGGFTTFSTYMVTIQRSITSGAPQVGLAYLAATLAGALLATMGGIAFGRLFARPHRRKRGRYSSHEDQT